MVEKIGVLNQGTVVNQTNYVTIQEGQKTALVYSDPLPSRAHFQGRSQEIQQINKWLKAGDIQIIGVRGEGGIGKSTLTAKAFADSVGFRHKCWLDVRTGKPLAIAARQALPELGIPPEQVQGMEEKDLPGRLLRLLQMEKCLLAIDNLESVLTETGEWLPGSGYGDFLANFSQLGSESVVLLASREYPLGYFGWSRFKELSLNEGLKPIEGAALLTDLEAEGSQQDLEILSQQVHGNPLALSLIAGWLRESYKPGERQITHVPQEDLLQLAPKYQGESQITVETVLLWSFQRLNDWQQQLLKRVSVLQDEFTADIAAALMADVGSEYSVNNDALRDLERRSLLQELPEPNTARLRLFRMQPRLREWVRTQASENEIKAAHLCAIQYFLGKFDTNFAPHDSLEGAYPQRAILYHQMQLGNYAAALEILYNCQNFLERRGYYSIFIDLSEQCLAIARETGDIANEAYILSNLSIHYQSIGNYLQAISQLEKALGIFQKMGDRNAECRCLDNLGAAYESVAEYIKAINIHKRSLAIARENGYRPVEASSLNNLGVAHQSMGKYQEAIDFREQSLTIFTQIEDPYGQSNSLIGLGNASQSLGRYEDAISFHQKSLAIAKKIGHRRVESEALNNLGLAHESLGKSKESIAFHRQSLFIARKISYRAGEGNCLGNLGNCCVSLGKYRRARILYEKSLAIFQEIGDSSGKSRFTTGLANTYLYLGEYTLAIDLYQQSLEITRGIGDRDGEAKALFNQAIALENLRDYEQARIYYQQAQSIYTELQLAHKVEQCQTALANCHPPAPISRLSRRQKLVLGFAIGLVVALVIWWLKK
jgi:tetratricopeptide (TPR) repeat protein